MSRITCIDSQGRWSIGGIVCPTCKYEYIPERIADGTTMCTTCAFIDEGWVQGWKRKLWRKYDTSRAFCIADFARDFCGGNWKVGHMQLRRLHAHGVVIYKKRVGRTHVFLVNN